MAIAADMPVPAQISGSSPMLTRPPGRIMHLRTRRPSSRVGGPFARGDQTAMARLRSRRVIIAAGAALALVAGGTAAGAAVASGPTDSSGVIHGCYTNQALNGSHVFVLQDTGTSCPKGSTAISWNQTGPAGPAGASGPKGDTGPAGAIGAPGPTGPAGPAGPAGNTGPPGPAGPAGATGPAGPAGSNGSTVLNGTGAPASAVGTDGDFYLDTGADVLYGPKTGGSWPTPGTSLVGNPGATGPSGPAGPQGPAGPAGADGNAVLNGSGAPGDSVGNDGDFYLDTSADVLYGPKAGGTWPTPGVSLVGNTGPVGPAGPQGAAGPQGPAGVGTAGPSGLDTTVVFSSATLRYGESDSVTVQCPAGHPYVLGGGGSFEDVTDGAGPSITGSIPLINGAIPAGTAEERGAGGWLVFATDNEDNGQTDPLQVWAICAE